MPDPVLNLLVIRASNLDRAATFYNAIGLTFTRHRHGIGPDHLVCELGPFVFELYPKKDEPDSTARTRLGFRVASLDLVVQRLQEIGATVVSPSKDSPWGRRAVVDDFDGHRVELTEANAAV